VPGAGLELRKPCPDVSSRSARVQVNGQKWVTPDGLGDAPSGVIRKRL